MIKVQRDMVYFRCSDNQYEKAADWYRGKGLSLKLMPLVMETIDNWLQSDTTNARKARKQETHIRRMYSPDFIEKAQKLIGIQSGGNVKGYKNRVEKNQEVLERVFGKQQDIIDI